jgi:protein-disulfide isomerase
VASADTATLSACFRAPRPDERTRRANLVANAIGVRVTPSFVVNERPIEGALPLADFRRVLDAALLLEKSKR